MFSRLLRLHTTMSLRTLDNDKIGIELITTRIGLFAECLKHSAKPRKHSTKSLPSVALGKESSVNSTSATAFLPSTFYRALGKDFAECHSVLGKENPPSRRLVTETAPLPSVLGDTWQRDYLFAKCPPAYTRQRGHQLGPLSVSLPSALGGTRQILLLYRVPGPQHSTKRLYQCPGVPSLPSVMTPDTRQSDQYIPF
jgi:hypothetical protein